MKKILLFIVFLAFIISGYAQTEATGVQYRGFPKKVVFENDTLTNADTLVFSAGMTYNSTTLPCTVEYESESVSGTVAASAQLQGSYDGVNWYDEGSAQTLTANERTYTSDAAAAYLKYRLRVITTGTQVNNMKDVTFYRME